jgi:glycosyltransferase involved in cell wall biosynthesis
MRKRLYIEATPLIEKKMSGVGHVLLELVRELDRTYNEHQLDVRLFVPFNEKYKMDKYVFSHVSIKILPFPHKVFSVMSRLKYSIPLDIFLGKGVYLFPNFRNWNLLNSKSITYIHDICFALYPQYVEPRNLAYIKKYIPIWLNRTSKIVTVSKSSKVEIDDNFNLKNKQVEVIYNGVKPQENKIISVGEKNELIKKYGLPNKFFVFVGNIEPRKNLVNTIKGFREANLGDEYGLFLIGGDGWLNEEVYSEINDAKSNGIFVKKNESYIEDDDVNALMRASEGLLLISHHEGFGLPAVEAQALGKPIVVSDIPVLREVTNDTVSKVLYVDKDSSKSIANAIREITKDANSSKSYNGEVEYTWEQSCSQLVDTVLDGKKWR